MSNKPSKGKTLKIDAKKARETSKRTLMSYQEISFGQDRILGELEKLTLKNQGKKKTKAFYNKFGVLLREAALAKGFETGQALTESVGQENYRRLAYNMKKDLEREFDCKGTHEKALVDLIANSYARKLFLSSRMMSNQNFEFYSNERTNHFNFLSKEIDRAHRQLLSALETLQALKQPPLKVNLRAENAFVAQNQQLNATRESPKKQEEINESK